jgi:hypothetical protein
VPDANVDAREERARCRRSVRIGQAWVKSCKPLEKKRAGRLPSRPGTGDDVISWSSTPERWPAVDWLVAQDVPRRPRLDQRWLRCQSAPSVPADSPIPSFRSRGVRPRMRGASEQLLFPLSMRMWVRPRGSKSFGTVLKHRHGGDQPAHRRSGPIGLVSEVNRSFPVYFNSEANQKKNGVRLRRA